MYNIHYTVSYVLVLVRRVSCVYAPRYIALKLLK